MSITAQQFQTAIYELMLGEGATPEMISPQELLSRMEGLGKVANEITALKRNGFSITNSETLSEQGDVKKGINVHIAEMGMFTITKDADKVGIALTDSHEYESIPTHEHNIEDFCSGYLEQLRNAIERNEYTEDDVVYKDMVDCYKKGLSIEDAMKYFFEDSLLVIA